MNRARQALRLALAALLLGAATSKLVSWSVAVGASVELPYMLAAVVELGCGLLLVPSATAPTALRVLVAGLLGAALTRAVWPFVWGPVGECRCLGSASLSNGVALTVQGAAILMAVLAMEPRRLAPASGERTN